MDSEAIANTLKVKEMRVVLLSSSDRKFLPQLEALFKQKYNIELGETEHAKPALATNIFWMIAMEGSEPVGFSKYSYHGKGSDRRIDLMEYYTPTYLRHHGVMTRLTMQLLHIARQQHIVTIQVPDPLMAVRNMLQKMQRNPRGFGKGAVPSQRPPETIEITDKVARFHLNPKPLGPFSRGKNKAIYRTKIRKRR